MRSHTAFLAQQSTAVRASPAAAWRVSDIQARHGCIASRLTVKWRALQKTCPCSGLTVQIASHPFSGCQKRGRQTYWRTVVAADAGEGEQEEKNARVSSSNGREKGGLEGKAEFATGRSRVAEGRDELWGSGQQPARRIIVAGLVGTSVVLGGNLAGITSLLLGLNPSFFRNSRADLIFPIQGFKRCVESSRGFEFIYPARWVGDQRLLYRAVERAERERNLDLPSLRIEQSRARRNSIVEPLVAYGPPGSDGELNVSVVVAPVASGFSLEMLGEPSEAGERILGKIIAPPGSDKVAILVDASERREGSVLYYTLEYIVKGPSFFRHNVSVYAAYQDLLYSLNAQTPESSWDAVRNTFVKMADSFVVTAPSDVRKGGDTLPQLL